MFLHAPLYRRIQGCRLYYHNSLYFQPEVLQVLSKSSLQKLGPSNKVARMKGVREVNGGGGGGGIKRDIPLPIKKSSWRRAIKFSHQTRHKPANLGGYRHRPRVSPVSLGLQRWLVKAGGTRTVINMYRVGQSPETDLFTPFFVFFLTASKKKCIY